LPPWGSPRSPGGSVSNGSRTDMHKQRSGSYGHGHGPAAGTL
jgi:hypothetical protein